MTTLKIGEKTYELKLTTKNSIMLEKALGKSLITMFMAIENGEMPKLQELLTILHYCLQALNANIDMNKVYDLYDEYVRDGKTMFDLIPVFINVFKDCGYIAKDATDTEESKN